MKNLAQRTKNFKDSIFGLMSQMAVEHQAINLAQGFPDFDGEDFIKSSAIRAIQAGKNQYAPFQGVLDLRAEVANYQRELYGSVYDPQTEVTITVGATEAIFMTMMTLIEEGDEVIFFEPFYDSYLASVEMAGGKVVPVTLHAPSFNFIEEELRKAITSKTKLIVLNNPHNPTGKVFNKEELEIIANIAKEFDLYIMSDEVYEFLVFDDVKHISIASLEGMKERTITISSAGKTFGVTGWKVGWILACARITDALRKSKQYISFAGTTPMQYAVAEALAQRDSYLPKLKALYEAKRNLFCEGLEQLGFSFQRPSGTYFIMLPIEQKTDLGDSDYCKFLIEKHKVALIPPSAFYLKSTDGEKYLRLCFAKKEETLKSALERLKGL